MNLRSPIDVSLQPHLQLSGRLQATRAVTSIPGGESDVLYLDDVIREAADDPPLARSLLNIETKVRANFGIEISTASQSGEIR